MRTPSLADGRHTFRVEATDQAGNVEIEPPVREFVVDTTVLRHRLKGKRRQRQRGRQIAVKLRAGGGENLRVQVSGRLQLPGKDARVASKSKDVASGELSRFKLEPRRRRDTRRARSALAKGKRVRAKLKVVYIDAVGNRKRRSITIKLR